MRPRLSRLVPLALTLLACLPAAAAERGPYGFEILVDGYPLDELPARGTTYVEAIPHREYTLRLWNHTGERVAVAVSVDGLNTIDARKTTARDARKWILDPWETMTVRGWQTGSSTARRFFFTTEDRSYGEWLGEIDDLGVVAAAFFRERYRSYGDDWSYEREESWGGPRRAVPRTLPAPSAAEPKAERSHAGGDARGAAPQSAAPPSAAPPSDDLAATGIGRETRHRVRRVHFDAEDHPVAVVELRYGYHDELVRLGVLPRWRDPLARRERARGFEEPLYAPDPYRR